MSRITPYSRQSADELSNTLSALETRYERLKRNNVPLDLTRGKPSDAQLDLSDALDGILQGNYESADGTDTRNYGGIRGLREARELGAELLGVTPDLVMAAGNSSLQLMHAAACFAHEQRWQNATPTMLCPVPGYDRHFTLCESLGLPMRSVTLQDDGPDMDQIEELVADDDSLGGIWCVPRFSNPTGTTYSNEVVARLAALPAKAAHKHFTVFWDNAYSVHALHTDAPALANVLDLANAAGTQDNLFLFASTSKITFAGSGVAFFGGSSTTLDELETFLSAATIGPDKVNQLRTVKFLKGRLTDHMAAHAAILKPKFDVVEDKLSTALKGLSVADWTTPDGGYFVSLNTLPGLAKSIIALAANAGVKLTAAGATWPGGIDPDDRNIRIAPSYPDPQELDIAMDVLVAAIQLASARYYKQLLDEHSARRDDPTPTRSQN